LFSFDVLHFDDVLFTEILDYYLRYNHITFIHWKNVVVGMNEIVDNFLSITRFLGDFSEFLKKISVIIPENDEPS
jgi:hypothetical protein